MKIQALVAAIALAFAGGAALAQTSSAPSTPAANAGTSATNGTASTPDATTDAKAMHKAHHAKRHHRHHVMRHHKHQHVSSADRDTMNSMHHMGAGPKVDLNSNDRQARMDQAYDDWKKNHG